jgi:hypothetical protein
LAALRVKDESVERLYSQLLRIRPLHTTSPPSLKPTLSTWRSVVAGASNTSTLEEDTAVYEAIPSRLSQRLDGDERPDGSGQRTRTPSLQSDAVTS